MVLLPIKRIILYKHGVGYFERRGLASGEQVRLNFPRLAMDDMLKSLVALDLEAGQVLSVDFETPEDRTALLAKGSIHLSDNRSLLDLLRDLRGRQVRCVLAGDPESAVEGLVVGVDYEDKEPLLRATVSIYHPVEQQVRTLPIQQISRVELRDDAASNDLAYFLRAAQSEEDRRSATLHLSPGEHDLLVGYIAPAPAWRVSYRLLYEESSEQDAASQPGNVLLQGWGLFDNQFDEDLADVRLTLVAGMPISFRYRLYAPKTPERPLVEDEERTVSAPVFFERAPPPAAAAPQAARAKRSMGRAAVAMEAMDDGDAAAGFAMAAEMEESVQVSASGSERGALFAYEISHPISVARGQSAMVPILSQRLPCHRDLLYNGRKLPQHPVASLRLTNETGLTLERGPVTVLENGDYAGEAVLPFTRTGGEVIVPFAVELGVNVEEQYDSERRIAGISIRNEYLLIEEYDLRHTIYHLTSALSQAVDVVIEHLLVDGYELTDTVEPREHSAGFARWSVACAPNARTVFTIHERKLFSRREHVRNLNGQRLQHFLHNRLLNTAAVQALNEVLQLYYQIDELQQRSRQIQAEREAIYQHQRQIQGNLEPLGREGDEGALRARYVAELNRQEDQLQTFAAEEQQLKQQIAALEQQASAKLRALSSDDK